VKINDLQRIAAYIRLVVWGALIFCAALLAGLSAVARTVVPVESGRVVEVTDGDTVTLAGGTEVRLVGIQAPKLALGRPGFRPWPLAEDAKRAVVALCRGRDATLAYFGRKIDRHGRLLAHLTCAPGIWVQGAMLERGLARVYTFADNRARAAEMLALESRARAAGRGIWALPFYAVRDAADPRLATGSFQLVAGTVVAAAVVRGRAYLNFGHDRRTDFTVTVAPRDLAAFGGAASIASYRGRRLRVRGWIARHGGPEIVATHPEQIEELK
jgi:endonuclease YncB( thermonuclease family)